VTDARSDIFLCISRRLEAGMSALDEEAVDLAVLGAAQTTATSAIVPFVIHIFAPLRIQSSRRASPSCASSRVGAGVGLRQAEAADRLARVHRRQPALLLLLRAPLPDREHRERALDRDEAADARVAGLELHAREAVHDRARPGRP
jgi:hypothetical protein